MKASKSEVSRDSRNVKQEHSACSDRCKVNFAFLKNSKFLHDLENDSVDSDLLEDELNAFERLPISKREKVVKFLQSNPVQILLCVIVLLDAGIVIAQILLDLNSVKEKLHRRDRQLVELIEFIRHSHSEKFHDYKGHNVDTVLRILRDHPDLPIQPAFMTTKRPVKLQNATNAESLNNESVLGNQINNSHVEIHHRLSKTSFPSNHIWLEMEEESDNDVMKDVAHGLHYASIALLGFLVVEVIQFVELFERTNGSKDFIKIVAMGWTFCKHRIEIFDAIIIASSFAIDLIFLGGVAGDEGQKAAAVLVILLLWRIARVVDGIVVTVKQRQEFRIRLQKRARRAAEKKLEAFESEKLSRTKQIDALKELCLRSGIPHSDVIACTPKHPCHVTTTLDALSSVAKLSVSMTMLMSSSSGGSSVPSNSRRPLLPDETTLTFVENQIFDTPSLENISMQVKGDTRKNNSLPQVNNRISRHSPFETIDENYYVTFTANNDGAIFDESQSNKHLADVIVHMEKNSSDDVEDLPAESDNWKKEEENPSFVLTPEAEELTNHVMFFNQV